MTETQTHADHAPSTNAGAARRKRVRRIGGAVLSVVVVVAIFAFAIPRIADYSEVWSTISSLTPAELSSIAAAMMFNLFTYWLANMAALPGLKLTQAAVVTQTTTSVANLIPAGGAVAVGLTYTILRSWGFGNHPIAIYVGVTGIWNVFLKLGLPIVALAALAITGQASGPLVAAALIGLAVLAVAVGLFALALWKKDLARRIGDGLGRAVSAVLRPFGKKPITTWGEQAVAFRRRTIELVAKRWLAITITTVLSHLALWLVLLLALRHVGISEGEVSSLQVLAVFAFGRLLGALPITPGGLGVVELGYIGGLVAAGGSEPKVVAAVLLFRVLTYVVQIPLGGFTYLWWRANSGWRREQQSEPAPVST